MKNCVYRADFGGNFAQLNVVKINFRMNLPIYCASNPRKMGTMTPLFMEIIQGFIKRELRQERQTIYISRNIEHNDPRTL